jgi:hypothetical protein
MVDLSDVFGSISMAERAAISLLFPVISLLCTGVQAANTN